MIICVYMFCFFVWCPRHGCLGYFSLVFSHHDWFVLICNRQSMMQLEFEWQNKIVNFDMSQLQQQKHKKMMNMEFLKDTRAKEPMKLSSLGWFPSDFVDFVCIPLLCQVGKYLLSPKQPNLPHKFWLSKLQGWLWGLHCRVFLILLLEAMGNNFGKKQNIYNLTETVDLFENLEYIPLTHLLQQPPTVLFCIH